MLPGRGDGASFESPEQWGSGPARNRYRRTELILPQSRQAGVCLHVTSLPGPYGIGEIGDRALQFIDALASMKLRVWQFLPLGPTAYGDSPYQPLSTFAGNEMLVDVASLIRLGLVSSNEADSLLQPRDESVDYGSLIPKKRALLNRAAERFSALAEAGLKGAYDDFLEEHDRAWLHDYALFRILKSSHGERPWPEWETEYVHRKPAAMKALEAREAVNIESVKIIQFLFHVQWQVLRRYAAEQGVRLFGDMPIYIALDSADAWAHPEILMIDRNGHPACVAGVPPDYFSEDGQLWGNPLYNWENHEHDGYQWWVDRMRATIDLADLVRIDHFRGFEAYWSVPVEYDTARNGEWRPGPGDRIFDAMRAALGQLPIVAEDLGVITPQVDELRERHQIPGMKVLQFEVADPEFDPEDIASDCVCYTGTHDNDTTVGWFRGSPGDIRTPEEIEKTRRLALEQTGGSAATIGTDLARLAYATDAMLAIAPMQDYLGLGSEARINIPGTSSNNWRWRLRADQLTPSFRDTVAQMVDEASRDASH